MRTLVPQEHEALHMQSRELTKDEVGSSFVHDVIMDMKTVLHQEKFGVAIAAPQIGEALRIFVVSGHIFANRLNEEYDPQLHPDQVFINPIISKQSKKLVEGDEGCLSVKGKYGTKVDRSEKVSITYLDEKGEPHERGASSFLARIFQHEVDHLNGVLYVDHAREVIDVDDELKPLK